MSTERAEFGVLMVDCAMRGCGADVYKRQDQIGIPGGIATLDADGHLTESQRLSLIHIYSQPTSPPHPAEWLPFSQLMLSVLQS